MALWGLTDDLAGAPKWLTKKETLAGTAFATTTITVEKHSFVNGAKVTWTNGTGLTGTNIASGTKYVKVLTNNTVELWENSALDSNRLSASNTGGTGHTIQVTPDDVYFVDAVEAANAANRKKGFHTPGWYQFDQKNVGEFKAGANLSTVFISNAAGRLTCDANTINIGDKVTITGADGGSNVLGNTYTAEDGVDYLVSAINTGTEGLNVTEFTVTEADGTAVTNFVATAIGAMPATLSFAVSPLITRNQAELLCAIGDPVSLGIYAGDDGVDGDDDSVVAGGAEGIIFTSQTTNMTESMANAAAATFSVVANSSTATGLAIKFFRSTDGVTYTELTDDGATNQVIVTAMSGGPGAATSQLTLTSNVGTGGATAGADATTAGAVVYYKATVEATGAATLTSDIVKLSVVGT